jgi:chromate transporter
VYVWYGQVPAIQSVLDFLKPAVVAIVAGAIVKIGKKSLHSPIHYVVSILAFAGLYFLKTPYLAIIIGAILVGVLDHYINRKPGKAQPQQKETVSEHQYVINSSSDTGDHRFSWIKLGKLAGSGILLWLTPLLLLGALSAYSEVWERLIFFFTKAALVTFGGAYAVLPYVAQVSVEKYGWLTQLQMLDGLALGETTPGPLIIVLAFVGFMAGYTVSGGAVWAATIGLVATVYYTFLPSFLFIFAGAPLIERTQTHPGAKAVLQFVAAAVTGVILSLCIQLGQAVLFSPATGIQWWALVWMAVTFAVLQYSKISMIGWIAISIAAGLFKFMLFQ